MIKQTLYVPIKLDKERKLRFDLNFVAELEEVYDRSFGEILSRYDKDFGARDLRKLVYAALKVDEPDLTLRGVGTMMSGVDFEEMSNAILQGLSASVGGPDPGNVESGPKEELTGTGKPPADSRSARSNSRTKSSSD